MHWALFAASLLSSGYMRSKDVEYSVIFYVGGKYVNFFCAETYLVLLLCLFQHVRVDIYIIWLSKIIFLRIGFICIWFNLCVFIWFFVL